nr:hypothetical protein [uncultured Roseateles sp.]
MPNASKPSRGGLSRGSLRSSPPQAARAALPPEPAPKPVALPASASALSEMFTTTLQVLGTLCILSLALAAAFAMRDSMAVGSHLSQAKAQRTDLICQDGRMVRGDGGLLDWMFEDAYFLCTDWRTLQAADQAQLRR